MIFLHSPLQQAKAQSERQQLSGKVPGAGVDVGQSAHQPLPVPLLQQLLVWVCVDHRDRVRVVRTGQSLHLVPEERIRAIRSYVLQIHYVFV